MIDSFRSRRVSRQLERRTKSGRLGVMVCYLDLSLWDFGLVLAAFRYPETRDAPRVVSAGLKPPHPGGMAPKTRCRQREEGQGPGPLMAPLGRLGHGDMRNPPHLGVVRPFRTEALRFLRVVLARCEGTTTRRSLYFVRSNFMAVTHPTVSCANIFLDRRVRGLVLTSDVLGAPSSDCALGSRWASEWPSLGNLAIY